MNTRFVDTNIFIEAFLREGEKAKKSLELLKSDQKLATSVLVISETEWVLRSVYELSKIKISKILASILTLPNLEIENKAVLTRSLEVFKNTNLDWTDCLSAGEMEKKEWKEIYSYDRDFDKLTFVKRREP